MTVRIPRHLLIGALAVAAFYSLLGVEVQCTQAAAERLSLSMLAAEIDALAAEADTAPIVVDGTGETLGPVLFIEGANETHWALVQFDLPDLPLFFLRVAKDDILTSGVGTWFESTDCTGQAWIDALKTTFGVTAFVRGVTVTQTGIRTFYVPDNSDSPEMIARRSLKNGSGDDFCEIDVSNVSAVRVTPVDLDAMFTPPFRVTTRERMQAQP